MTLDTKAIREKWEALSRYTPIRYDEPVALRHCVQVLDLISALESARADVANKRADIRSLDCDWYETNDRCPEGRPCLRCQLEDSRVERKAVSEQNDFHKRQIAELNTELALPCSGCGCTTSTTHAEAMWDVAANTRALMAEEAARLADQAEGVESGRNGSDLGDSIRALAPLESSLVVVRREELAMGARWIALLLEECAHGMTSGYSKEKVRDFLALLEGVGK